MKNLVPKIFFHYFFTNKATDVAARGIDVPEIDLIIQGIQEMLPVQNWKCILPYLLKKKLTRDNSPRHVQLN